MAAWSDGAGMGRSYNYARMAWRGWLAAALVALGATGAIGQPDAGEARELAARAAQRIRSLQREADQLAAQARSVFNDLRKLELDRAIAQQRVTEADAALQAVTGERDDAATRVERLEAARGSRARPASPNGSRRSTSAGVVAMRGCCSRRTIPGASAG